MAARRKQVPARRRGPSPTLRKTQAQLSKARSALSRARKKSKQNSAGSIENSLAVIAGGLIAGASQAKMPEIAGIDTRLGIGVAGVVAGTWLLKGQIGSYVTCAGAGVLAVYAADMAEGMLADAEGDADAEAA